MSPLCESVECCVARLAISSWALHLDEFMIVQGTGRFLCHGVSETGSPNADDRFEGMGETTEVLALFLG